MASLGAWATEQPFFSWAERDSQIVQLSLQGTSVSVPRSDSHGPVLTQGQVCCVASDKALSFSGPHLSVDTAGTQQKWSRAWRKYNFSTQGVIHGHTFMTLHLALVPRETNLKFRQALMVTHRELTSPKKMASFQGEGMEAACVPLYASFAGSIWMVGRALHSSVPVLCLCQPVCSSSSATESARSAGGVLPPYCKGQVRSLTFCCLSAKWCRLSHSLKPQHPGLAFSNFP